MENSTTQTIRSVWLLFAVSTVGMLIFAGLYFLNPRTFLSVQDGKPFTNTITKTVVNTVTNEVVREVPKEVEKLVKVPAEIPPEYLLARNIYEQMTNASFVADNQILFKMTNVQLQCRLDNEVKKVISEDEVRAKFELTLRRNNVPIDPNSLNVVAVGIAGFFDPSSPSLLCYDITYGLYERQFIFRGGECHMGMVTVWSKNDLFGTVGKERANQDLLTEVEKRAEIFANDFLSANPKSK